MENLKSLHSQKLWHQFTIAMLQYSKTHQDSVAVFEQLVLPNHDKLNHTAYVQISIQTAQFMAADKALLFLQQVADTVQPADLTASSVNGADGKTKVDQSGKDVVMKDAGSGGSNGKGKSAVVGGDLLAYVLCRLELSRLHLTGGNVVESRLILDDCEQRLHNQSAVTSVDADVNASFYRVSAEYFKRVADYTQYYKCALLFLACVTVERLSGEESQQRAVDLSMAALMGDGVYNFGELLQHPIMGALKQTADGQVLEKLLLLFNRGDLDGYDQLLQQSNQFQQSPGQVKSVLGAQGVSVYLRQKLCLMSLVEVVFKAGGGQFASGNVGKGSGKTLSFAVIGQQTRVPQNEIEHLVMKALSLKLITGRINQVQQTLIVESVQSRVLDAGQLQTVKQQIGSWKDRVAHLGQEITTKV